MRGGDLNLEGHAEPLQHARGFRHSRQIRVAAHDDTHKHRFELDADQQRIAELEQQLEAAARRGRCVQVALHQVQA